MEPSAANIREDATTDATTDRVDAPEATEVLVEEISIDGMCGVY
jgi:mycofactocin precursor